MPFRLPEYEDAFTDFVSRVVFSLAQARSPMLAQIRSEDGLGASASVVETRDIGRVDLGNEPVRFGMTSGLEDVRCGNWEALVVQLDSASEQLADELMRVLVATLQKVTDSTGNSVDAGGELNFDAIYAALDRLEWSLDDNDELQMPQLLMHPDTAEKLQALPDLDDNQQAQLDGLKKRKHEELLARRRRRRLS